MGFLKSGHEVAEALGLEVHAAELGAGGVENLLHTHRRYTLRLPRVVGTRFTLERSPGPSAVALPHGYRLRTEGPKRLPLERAVMLIAHELREADFRFSGDASAISVVAPKAGSAASAQRLHRLLLTLAEAVLKSGAVAGEP